MKILFAFLLGFAGFATAAQDSWKVCLGNKLLLKAKAEDEQKNIVPVQEIGTKKLVLLFHQASPKKGWERSIVLFDENDRELKREQGVRFELQAGELNDFFKDSKTLKLYTIYLPDDPGLRAKIRVRRVHLCTLVLQ